MHTAAYTSESPGSVRKQPTTPFANPPPPSDTASGSTHTAPSILDSDEETLCDSDVEFDPEDDTYSDLDHSWGPRTSHRRARPSTSTSNTPVHMAVSAVKKGVVRQVQRIKGIVKPHDMGVPAGVTKSAPGHRSDSEVVVKYF